MRTALLPGGAAPMASGIKTFQVIFSLCLHSTLLPQAHGRRHGQRLASPLHGNLTPGRISVGRPPCMIPESRGGWDWAGVSLSLTESLRTQPATGCFSGGWNRFAPYLAVIDAGCPAQVVLAHPPASLAPLGASSGTYPGRRIFGFQAARGR